MVYLRGVCHWQVIALLDVTKRSDGLDVMQMFFQLMAWRQAWGGKGPKPCVGFLLRQTYFRICCVRLAGDGEAMGWNWEMSEELPVRLLPHYLLRLVAETVEEDNPVPLFTRRSVIV